MERVLVVLEVLLGLGALAGGAALVIAPDGWMLHMPLSMLRATPFANFLLPGIVLFTCLGMFPLVVALGTLVHARWAHVAHVAVGIGLVVWMATQIAMIGYGSIVQALYLALGFAICLIAGRQLWSMRIHTAQPSEGHPGMPRKFTRELVARNLPRSDTSQHKGAQVTQTDLDPLPEPVQRYLRFMGVVGRPRDWSFRLGLTGRFRRSLDQPWMKCTAWQYNTLLGLVRIFHLRVRFFGIVPVLGRDTYADGRGRMLVRICDLITVADGTGDAYDVGELVTYLNDGVLIAPSMLLGPDVSWATVDASSFDVSLTDRGRTVKARVFIDERGAPLKFETTDRFYADPKNPTKVTRCRWTTPIEGWREIAGHRIYTRGQAVWHLPEGQFAYADFSPTASTVKFNVPPGE